MEADILVVYMNSWRKARVFNCDWHLNWMLLISRFPSQRKYVNDTGAFYAAFHHPTFEYFTVIR